MSVARRDFGFNNHLKDNLIIFTPYLLSISCSYKEFKHNMTSRTCEQRFTTITRFGEQNFIVSYNVTCVKESSMNLEKKLYFLEYDRYHLALSIIYLDKQLFIS